MALFSPVARRITGFLCALVGAGLLVVASVGHFTPWGSGYSSLPRDWERFDPTLPAQLPTYTALSQRLDEKLTAATTDADRLRAIYDLVIARFTHDEAQHTLASNWILYAAGFIHPTFHHIWSPQRLVSHGSCLLCDQASYLMLDLARAHGYKARQIGLQGHVVMEAWYQGDWHLYDADLEIIPTDSTGEVLSLDELAASNELRQRYYGPHSNMAELIRARENHLYMSTPEGARFEWKGNLLALLEKAAELLKFLLPLFALFVGIRLLRPARPRSV